MTLECKTITVAGQRLTSVCQYDGGQIAVMDAAWIVIGPDGITARINRPAMEALMQLPHSPTLHAPYMAFIRGNL